MSESTMKERPILFSGPMVRAILEGRKTQTRRVVKPQPKEGLRWCPHSISGLAETFDGGKCTCQGPSNPYGQPGDRLWVRETFQHTDQSLNSEPGYVYRATDPDWESMEGWTWRPSIFMPRKASRITLEITGVGIERLQDISEEDAVAEGVELGVSLAGMSKAEVTRTVKLSMGGVSDYRFSFASLWESINGPGSWDANPWVWVVEFRRVQP